jgi:hypothetical protein
MGLSQPSAITQISSGLFLLSLMSAVSQIWQLTAVNNRENQPTFRWGNNKSHPLGSAQAQHGQTGRHRRGRHSSGSTAIRDRLIIALAAAAVTGSTTLGAAVINTHSPTHQAQSATGHSSTPASPDTGGSADGSAQSAGPQPPSGSSNARGAQPAPSPVPSPYSSPATTPAAAQPSPSHPGTPSGIPSISINPTILSPNYDGLYSSPLIFSWTSTADIDDEPIGKCEIRWTLYNRNKVYSSDKGACNASGMLPDYALSPGTYWLKLQMVISGQVATEKYLRVPVGQPPDGSVMPSATFPESGGQSQPPGSGSIPSLR